MDVSDDCADVVCGVCRARRATIVMMSFGFTEPPSCAPQHITCAPNEDRMPIEKAMDVISALLPSYSLETRSGIVSSVTAKRSTGKFRVTPGKIRYRAWRGFLFAHACSPRQFIAVPQCSARAQTARVPHYVGSDYGRGRADHGHDYRAGRERLCRTEDRHSGHKCFPDRAHAVRRDRLQRHHYSVELQKGGA